MKTVRRNGKAEEGTLVIINLQETHLDRHATLRYAVACVMVISVQPPDRRPRPFSPGYVRSLMWYSRV
jgi:hypothetical protein